jgi:ATP-binding cassette subfamily B protein
MQVSNLAVWKAFWLSIRRYALQLAFTTFFVAAATVLDLVSPFWYKDFFNTIASSAGNAAAATSAASALLGILYVILGLNAARWFCFRIAGFSESFLVSRIDADMDEGSFAHLLGHSHAFFTNTFSGTLARRIRRFSEAFETLYVNVVWSVLIVLFLRNAILGETMAVFIALIAAANVAFFRWKMKYDAEAATRDSNVSGALTDAISNSVNVKMFAAERHESNLFHEVRDLYRQSVLKRWCLAEAGFAVQALLMIGIEFGTLYVAIPLWTKGILTIGDFALIQAYLIALFDRFWNFGKVLRQIFESLANAKEMVEIVETPYEVADTRMARPFRVTRGEIEFADVTFCYSQTRKTLDRFSLRIEPGERVALVGPSGAGKSTVVKLLLRFFDVTSGSIRIDGRALSDVTQNSLRSQIAFVPQDPILFHRSLLDNIRYGKLSATKNDVIAAARKARCHEFITDLPEGYDTFVGERGIKLSGGERQRVAIARAILKNAPILVLDEATSSLDSESESLIQDALKTLMKGKTTIVIAHRLSTVMQMDRIVVMKSGRIIDQGTHQDLLERQGIYKKLWEIQAGGFLR